MSSTNFQTENNTFRKLMGPGLSYVIPRFQRDYSWTSEEWEDLWADLVEAVSSQQADAHYMGYLVLQSKSEKLFDVIDGQQRITTISILILAAMRVLQKLVQANEEPEDNETRIRQFRDNYIGYLDTVSLRTQSKLTLNRNNDSYYQTYLVTLRDLPQRGFKASEHAMRKASDWFERKIEEYVKKSARDEMSPGQVVADLVEKTSDRLFFTVITVTDQLNAYKVFETLNSRGVRLSATDLLKNYLFAALSKHGKADDLDTMDDRWNALVGRLGEENFPNFLRVFWITHHALVRQTDLFKTIRDKVSTRDQVFELINGLDADLDTYLTLGSPETSSWSGESKRLVRLLKTFGVRQQYPVLIAARGKLSAADYETLLRGIVVISFRYNVIARMQASEQERVYSTVAQRISRGEVTDLVEVLAGLKPIYVSDRAFKSAFAEVEIVTTNTRNRSVVMYILCKLERDYSGNEYDPDADSFNVEHILPQSPGDAWDFTDADASSSIYRLGNMTLLNAKANKDLDNTSFETKKPVYEKSEFQITRDLTEFEDWNVAAVGKRQAAFANRAASIWKVSQLADAAAAPKATAG